MIPRKRITEMEQQKKWKVVAARPGQNAVVLNIPADVCVLHRLIKGKIIITRPVTDDTAVLCGRYDGSDDMRPNRAWYGEDCSIRDVYHGTIVCIGQRNGDSGFSSLTDAETALYLMLYGKPGIH